MRLHYLVLEAIVTPINSDLIILILQKDTYTTSSPGSFPLFLKPWKSAVGTRLIHTKYFEKKYLLKNEKKRGGCLNLYKREHSFLLYLES